MERSKPPLRVGPGPAHRTFRPVTAETRGDFERLFETTCARLRTDRLELYGVACVDDREAFQENVWGSGGMVEFLLRKKEEGRLGAIFCTTHGSPEYVRGLIERHNPARDRSDALAGEWQALTAELERAEAEETTGARR